MIDKKYLLSHVDGYEVEIVLDPENGPYLIGNSIDCYCFVVPTPPGSITYQWNVPGLYYSYQNIGQNFSYTPYEVDLHYLHFYCKVFSNSTIVAQGKRMIEVYGEWLRIIHGVTFSSKI